MLLTGEERRRIEMRIMRRCFMQVILNDRVYLKLVPKFNLEIDPPPKISYSLLLFDIRTCCFEFHESLPLLGLVVLGQRV